ncbi:hypothetical protein [Geotalea sp. SG265]|uniref:hypothetical protein n=1 Tax=Geotalea sp. SG265 TaxID=2922867 RepID=UPI001FAF98E7|nr:hypothetical protein [Geotalea sp. SG265]
MDDLENQMGLFEIPKIVKPAPVKKAVEKPAPVRKAIEKVATQGAKRTRQVAVKPLKRGVKAATVKAVSGLVPEGDVRLTANIRQDLHLKLKIAAAHRRTTIGEMIEELIDRYVADH